MSKAHAAPFRTGPASRLMHQAHAHWPVHEAPIHSFAENLLSDTCPSHAHQHAIKSETKNCGAMHWQVLPKKKKWLLEKKIFSLGMNSLNQEWRVMAPRVANLRIDSVREASHVLVYIHDAYIPVGDLHRDGK